MEKSGKGKMRVMTDVSAEQYLDAGRRVRGGGLRPIHGQGSSPEMKELEPMMKDYHDLVDRGRREIYKVEG